MSAMPGVRRKVTDLGDGGCAARRVSHGAGVVEGVAERLLAQHVLAGGQQSFDDVAVQGIGDNDADHIDVVGSGDGLP